LFLPLSLEYKTIVLLLDGIVQLAMEDNEVPRIVYYINAVLLYRRSNSI
jgi:hypothetical protein